MVHREISFTGAKQGRSAAAPRRADGPLQAGYRSRRASRIDSNSPSSFPTPQISSSSGHIAGSEPPASVPRVMRLDLLGAQLDDVADAFHQDAESIAQFGLEDNQPAFRTQRRRFALQQAVQVHDQDDVPAQIHVAADGGRRMRNRRQRRHGRDFLHHVGRGAEQAVPQPERGIGLRTAGPAVGGIGSLLVCDMGLSAWQAGSSLRGSFNRDRTATVGEPHRTDVLGGPAVKRHLDCRPLRSYSLFPFPNNSATVSRKRWRSSFTS